MSVHRSVVVLFLTIAFSAASPRDAGARGAHHAWSSELIELPAPPAGVAARDGLVFVGSPLEGRVLVATEATGQLLSELPLPPVGYFALPFILHSIGHGRLAVLDAGGLPSPSPFVPASPTIYEYTYSYGRGGFSASVTRVVSFEGVPFGFAEDFVGLDDGRYVVSDAIYGALWIVEKDGQIEPGIVPQTFEPGTGVTALRMCPTMPLIQVGGLPFLFSGATNPGVEALAVRDGRLFFYSPCAEGLYSVPISSLADAREPWDRAADITLVSPKPHDVAVEQLLGLAFDPYDRDDPWLYAADSLQLRLIRIHARTGRREVVADNPRLFNFPSSTGFAGPLFGHAQLLVVSNQQHRTALTNGAITEDVFEPPFIVTRVFLDD
jgi:hypothetical protein